MILQFTSEKLKQLLTDLDGIDFNAQAELPAVLHSAKISYVVIKEVADYLATYTFGSQAEEIEFFKTWKPQIDGRLVYYTKLSAILQLAPVADNASRKSYFQAQLLAIEEFYHRNFELYHYHQMNYSYLDTYYFTRQPADENAILDELYFIMDKSNHTRQSNLYAHFYANRLLSAFLNMLLTDAPWDIHQNNKSRLTWTGTQSQLIELLTAVNETGNLNGQRQEIKMVAALFGQFLNIKISNPYATQEDNRMRKKDNTAYLNLLLSALTKKYEYDDLHAL